MFIVEGERITRPIVVHDRDLLECLNKQLLAGESLDMDDFSEHPEDEIRFVFLRVDGFEIGSFSITKCSLFESSVRDIFITLSPSL
jgi:hypothetical protein